MGRMLNFLFCALNHSQVKMKLSQNIAWFFHLRGVEMLHRLETGYSMDGVRSNESWDAGDNWNDSDKNGDKRTMRQRCVTEHSDYIILPQD